MGGAVGVVGAGSWGLRLRRCCPATSRGQDGAGQGRRAGDGGRGEAARPSPGDRVPAEELRGGRGDDRGASLLGRTVSPPHSAQETAQPPRNTTTPTRQGRGRYASAGRATESLRGDWSEVVGVHSEALEIPPHFVEALPVRLAVAVLGEEGSDVAQVRGLVGRCHVLPPVSGRARHRKGGACRCRGRHSRSTHSRARPFRSRSGRRIRPAVRSSQRRPSRQSRRHLRDGERPRHAPTGTA